MKKIINAVVLSLSVFLPSIAIASSLLQVSELHTERARTGLVTINGTAKNLTNQVIGTASIEFNLYKDGVLVQKAKDVTNDIQPNADWTFLAFTQVPFDKYEISSIEAYNLK